MGAAAARITAEDFLTPPEFARWSLATQPAGRIGGVRLQFEADSEETKLTQCYQQIPLRVLPPFRFGPGQPSLVYLLNPTAGLMDGDAHLMHVQACEGSRTVVVGQSATRIHPAVQSFSMQQWHIRVERGAVLVILPGPAIPFRGARYVQRVRIDLEKMPGSSGAISGMQAGTLEAKLPSSFNSKLSSKTLRSIERSGGCFGIGLSGRDLGMRKRPPGTLVLILPAGAYLPPGA